MVAVYYFFPHYFRSCNSFRHQPEVFERILKRRGYVSSIIMPLALLLAL